ncbi:MAG: zinc-finger domain-containing protein [Ferrovum sp.]|nr:zinc-finger domain-containing protein [Ferrovum sp.]NDU86590.1 zinc-finger domain-containing protein [Ferrovum sp.]
MSDSSQPASTVHVTAKDLPLHCPPPNASLWDAHPRVYLDIARTGHIACPYCGTHYELSGPAPHGH